MAAPAVPSGIKTRSSDPHSVSLNWAASGGAVQYNVYGKRVTGVTSSVFEITQVVTKEFARFEGLGPGKYFFVITARNGLPEISADSSEVIAKVGQGA